MLAIRMQRTGRKGHAMFRVIVQDARRTPTSGKIVARLGSYDPHAKTVTLDKEKASFYLEHGAQPSDRAALLLKKEGIKLPDWVKVSAKQEGAVRNPEKRRSTRPDEPEPAKEAPTTEPEAAETSADEPAAPETETEKPAEATETAEAAADEPAAPEAEAKKPEESPEATIEVPADKSEEPAEEPADDKPAEDTAPAEEEKSGEDKS